jgi:hypothetical protein
VEIAHYNAQGWTVEKEAKLVATIEQHGGNRWTESTDPATWHQVSRIEASPASRRCMQRLPYAVLMLQKGLLRCLLTWSSISSSALQEALGMWVVLRLWVELSSRLRNVFVLFAFEKLLGSQNRT